jgi:hypothetical protein
MAEPQVTNLPVAQIQWHMRACRRDGGEPAGCAMSSTAIIAGQPSAREYRIRRKARGIHLCHGGAFHATKQEPPHVPRNNL